MNDAEVDATFEAFDKVRKESGRRLKAELMGWRLDMEAAPRDRVIHVVGRYPEAMAGVPTYAAWQDETKWGPAGFYVYSRNAPERLIVWAWAECGDWPEEPRDPSSYAQITR